MVGGGPGGRRMSGGASPRGRRHGGLLDASSSLRRRRWQPPSSGRGDCRRRRRCGRRLAGGRSARPACAAAALSARRGRRSPCSGAVWVRVLEDARTVSITGMGPCELFHKILDAMWQRRRSSWGIALGHKTIRPSALAATRSSSTRARSQCSGSRSFSRNSLYTPAAAGGRRLRRRGIGDDRQATSHSLATAAAATLRALTCQPCGCGGAHTRSPQGSDTRVVWPSFSAYPQDALCSRASRRWQCVG